jgi:hypothetical protein
MADNHSNLSRRALLKGVAGGALTAVAAQLNSIAWPQVSGLYVYVQSSGGI